MSDINDLVDKQRDALKMRDFALLAKIQSDYQNVIGRILRELGALQSKIDAATASGEKITPAWLFQERRLKDFLSQASREFDRFSKTATATTAKEQFVQVEMAEQHFFQQATNELGAGTMLEAGLTFNRLPTRAIEGIVARSSDGSPLKKLFDQLGPDLGKDLRDELVQAVALGQAPAKTARRIRELVAGNAARAQTIARTETIQAYREGAHQTSIENDDVLEGWVWISTLDGRGCAACIALNGTFHKLEERMKCHPNCRCTKRFETKSFEDLGVKGIGETAPAPVEPGHRWFDNAPEETWQSVLGKSGAQAYKSGAAQLRDFVGLRQDPQWGDSYFQRALKDALKGPQPGLPRFVYRFPIIPPPPPPPPKPVKPKPIPKATATALAPLPAPSSTAQTAVAAREQIEQIALKHMSAISNALKAYERDKQARQQREKEISWNERFTDLKYKNLRDHEEASKAVYDLVIEKRRADFQASLRVKKPANPGFTFASKVDAARKETWNKALAAFREFVEAGPLESKSVTFKASPKKRSDYNNASQVNLAKAAPVHVVVHELGHWLEDMSSDMHARILDFYDKRTQGEKTVSMKSIFYWYAAGERTKKDKFIEPYMGKEYVYGGRQYATEILSMGLEYFYKDALALARDDPDYFDFIYDLVRGRETRGKYGKFYKGKV